MFEYTTLTVKIQGARSGAFSWWQNKGLQPESEKALTEMGQKGWEMTGVIPLVVGAVGGTMTDSAICFFKREIAQRKAGQDRTLQNGAIASDEFDLLLNRRILEERFATDEGLRVGLSQADWAFIVKDSYPEALVAVEKCVSSWRGSENLESVKEFYSRLPRLLQMQSAYRLIETMGALDTGTQVIQHHQLFNAELTMKLLAHQNHRVRICALEILFANKPEYDLQDSVKYKELMTAVEQAFPEQPLLEKKGMLGKVTRYWCCQMCVTAEWPEPISRCETCGADRRGIPQKHGSLDGVLKRLERRAHVLEQHYAQANSREVPIK